MQVGVGLFYYGTDGRGDLMDRRSFIRRHEGEDLVRYRGKYPNRNHEFDHREEYHLPVFRRETRRRDASYLVEWWVSERDRTETVGEYPDRELETVIHVGQDNDYLTGLLTYWKRDRDETLATIMDPPPMTVSQDIETPAMDHDIIVETVFREDPLTNDDDPSVRDSWETAEAGVADIRRVLARLSDIL